MNVKIVEDPNGARTSDAGGNTHEDHHRDAQKGRDRDRYRFAQPEQNHADQNGRDLLLRPVHALGQEPHGQKPDRRQEEARYAPNLLDPFLERGEALLVEAAIRTASE